MAKHYVGEIGTDILLDVGVSIADATAQFIKYLKPDGETSGSWSADVYSSYSKQASATGTYFIKYTLGSGDLSTAGEWKLQAYVATAAGTWLGETVDINILNAFE